MQHVTNTDLDALAILSELDMFELDRLKVYCPKVFSAECARRLEQIEADRDDAVAMQAEQRAS